MNLEDCTSTFSGLSSSEKSRKLSQLILGITVEVRSAVADLDQEGALRVYLVANELIHKIGSQLSSQIGGEGGYPEPVFWKVLVDIAHRGLFNQHFESALKWAFTRQNGKPLDNAGSSR